MADEMERRQPRELTREEISKIASAAADEVLQRIYAEAGKTFLRSALYIIGAGVLALLTWLGATGKIK